MKRRILSFLMVAALVISLIPVALGEGADDPIEFVFYNADGKNADWNNPVAKAITEATGVSLVVKYPVSSQGDAKEDVALWIASDEFPDLIYSKGEATNLYEAGALIDMTDLIEQYGPNIKRMYGEELVKLQWGAGDEGIYQLSYQGVNAQTLTTGGSCQIQYAALKENDWKYPTTLEAYEALIKKYLAAHPTTAEGVEMLGMTISCSDWRWLITLGNPAGFIADAQPDNGQWLVDQDYNVLYKHVTEEEKEYFRWLNRMFHEGILDPNFATQTDDDYIAKLASGRVVAITDALWHYNQAQQALVADGKMEQTYAGLPVTLREDQKSPTLQYQGLQVGWGVGISKSCKDPVRAVKFLDYLCSDEGQILYQWGVLGVNYFLDDQGMPYRTAEETAFAQSDPDYSKKTGVGNYTGFPIYGPGAVRPEDGFPYTPTTRATVKADYNDIQKEACEAWGVDMLIDIFPQPDEFELLPYSPIWAYQKPQELQDMEVVLNDIAWPGLVKCVTGSMDDFDANWEAMVQLLTANGLRETEAGYTEFLAEKIAK